MGQAGTPWDTMGFGNFRVGNYHWDRLGKQRETMHMHMHMYWRTYACYKGSGNNGKQWIW